MYNISHAFARAKMWREMALIIGFHDSAVFSHCIAALIDGESFTENDLISM